MTSVMHHVVSRGRVIVGMVFFGLLVTVVAVVGALAAGSASDQYLALNQPAWAPPSWLFGPVWTVLYALIALAGWRLWWSSGSLRSVRNEMALYGVGLVLNALWTPLFFAANLPLLALVEIVLLDVVIFATILAFARRDRAASAFLIPYQLWVLFATALNAAIVMMN